jgi:hypothetical protein
MAPHPQFRTLPLVPEYRLNALVGNGIRSERMTPRERKGMRWILAAFGIGIVIVVAISGFSAGWN